MRRTRVGLAERSPQEELAERVQQDSSRAGFSDRSGFGLAERSTLPNARRRTTQAFSFCNQCIVLVRSLPVSYLLSILTTLSTAIPETKSRRCQLLNMNKTNSNISLFSYNSSLQSNGIHTQVTTARSKRMATIRKQKYCKWHPSVEEQQANGIHQQAFH
jgi:hypothetical protein